MTGGRALHVLALEPYLGGSHRRFLEGYRAASRHRVEILGFPAWKWKWRVRHAPLSFVRSLGGREALPDLLLCSSFVDLATLRGLLPPRWRQVPAVLYMQENQLTYPLPDETERDYAFGFMHVHACLAADRVLWNTAAHRDAFLGAVAAAYRRMADHAPEGVVEAIVARSEVVLPGIDLEGLGPQGPAAGGEAVVLWPHRREWDKDPEAFFAALDRLVARGVRFRARLLAGERTRLEPPAFEEALRRLAGVLEDPGPVTDRSSYGRFLSGSDIVVSTARQETFGFAVCEAIARGCHPLLPDRLSYPEILPAAARPTCLYRSPAGLARALEDLVRHVDRVRAGREERMGWMAGFDWRFRAPVLDGRLEAVVGVRAGIEA